MSNEPFAVAEPPATRRSIPPELEQIRFYLRMMAIAFFTACGGVLVLLIRLNIANRNHEAEIKQIRATAHQQQARANSAIVQARSAVNGMYLFLADNSSDPEHEQIPPRRRSVFLKMSKDFLESLDRDNDLDETSHITLARILRDIGDVHLGLEEYEQAENAYTRSLSRYNKAPSERAERNDTEKRLNHAKEIVRNLPPSDK